VAMSAASLATGERRPPERPRLRPRKQNIERRIAGIARWPERPAVAAIIQFA